MDQKYRLVIVEDQTIIREGLRSLLSSAKEFDIVGEAGDGREAIRCIEKCKPDLVLTDLSMPRMDGMDVIETIKKQSPQTKIIALTVHREEEYVLDHPEGWRRWICPQGSQLPRTDHGHKERAKREALSQSGNFRKVDREVSGRKENP